MNTLKLFGYESDGSSRVWWHWQNLSKERKPNAWAKNGRAWLHIPYNCFGVEWHLFSRHCAICMEFSTTNDNDISFSIGIPFVISLYFSIDRAPFVKRLPGVKWSGKYGSGERELGLRIFEWALWWNIWTYPGESRSWWREGSFHFDDFLLGRTKHSKSEPILYQTFLEMPEGSYPVEVELYTSTWKRPRWPWSKSVQRANVEIEGGVPVPGKGENSYDCEDDAIYGSTFPAVTVDEALKTVYESALRDRLRYGGPEWVPSAGWPAHCEISPNA